MKHNEMSINLKGILFTGIVVLMLISLILPGMTGSWTRNDAWKAYTYVFHYSTLTTLCSYMATCLIYLLLLVCIWSNHAKGKALLFIYLSTLVFIVWTLFTIYEASFQAMLFDDASINMILVPLFYLLGYEKSIFESARRMMPYILVLMCGLILWSCASFIMQFGVSTETIDSPSKEMFAVAISAYWCYSLGTPDNNRFHRSFKYVLGICLLICAFLIRSRSWVIQCVLLLYAMSTNGSGKKAARRKVLAVFSVVLVFALIIYMLPNVTGALFDRANEDTRSGQYEIFFSQVEPASLIWGQGYNASYSYIGNENYRYFDNQFIYMMFHYGALPVLCLLGVISGLFRKINKDHLTAEERAYIIGCRMMSFFFLAALGGLSVYFKFGCNLSTLLVFIFIGRGLEMMSESRKLQNHNELQVLKLPVAKSVIYLDKITG
ncbi:hypothetical protein [Paenibacillus sp. OV219]|uniref:hypothetical protein n=1 Tax=Paenibacillus sp. OV219 TaxID=1884377 RepID=UPI0008C8D303|nr:hypothetical protein [Paenibacillus sp. OV219]SEO64033.1 hypothetical protein SAMN05518847_109107 [Paenibacillus sp. OV219]